MTKAVFLSLLLCLLVPAGWAQLEDEPTDAAPTSSVPERKHPSFWHRPKYDTPVAQLAYAKRLEERGAKRQAAKQYLALVHQWNEAPEAVTAQFEYSRLLEDRGKYARAFDEYQYLIHFYPLRVDYNEVLARQFAIANQVMTDRRMTMFVFKGFAAPERALTMFERIVENAPQWSRAPEAQYRIGWIHEQINEFDEAVSAYGTVLHRYPGSEFAEPAAFRRAACLYRIARRSPRDEVACRNALSALATYLTKYSGDKDHEATAADYVKELKSRLARMYYERASFYDRTGRPKSALLTYKDFAKKFPDDPLAGDALSRIDVLTSQMEHEHEEQ